MVSAKYKILHVFQKVFPEEFGPTYDEALHTLMCMFLSRLEKFLPLQTFQQVRKECYIKCDRDLKSFSYHFKLALNFAGFIEVHLFYLFPPFLFHFLQVASMFGEASSVLEECMDSVSRRDEVKTLLQYQKDLSQLDHNGKTL